MTTYLRCISNKGFIWQHGKLLDEELASLTIGKLYKIEERLDLPT